MATNRTGKCKIQLSKRHGAERHGAERHGAASEAFMFICHTRMAGCINVRSCVSDPSEALMFIAHAWMARFSADPSEVRIKNDHCD